MPELEEKSLGFSGSFYSVSKKTNYPEQFHTSGGVLHKWLFNVLQGVATAALKRIFGTVSLPLICEHPLHILPTGERMTFAAS